MKAVPALLRARRQLGASDIDAALVRGPWWRLVFAPTRPAGAVDKAAYVFCVLTQFHRHLKRGNIYAEASGRWRDLRAQLLGGQAWATGSPN
jgi:hypothetical protein